jgi:hypothetical protein
MTLSTKIVWFTMFAVFLSTVTGCVRSAKVITLPGPVLTPSCRPERGQGEPEAEVASRENEELVEKSRELDELKAKHDEQAAKLVTLEERYKALEIELAGTVEEVLRAKASTRGFESRAFAALRIAEVRVQVETLSQTSDDAEVTDRLRRVGELLTRADQSLAEENFSGAAFLAERAGELVHQAGLISEYRMNVSNEMDKALPIVPSRPLEARVNCNLREGPSLDARRVGGLVEGEMVYAVARLGDWYQIETKSGGICWLHRSVVR